MRDPLLTRFDLALAFFVGLGSRLLLSVNYEAPPGAAASKGARFDHSRPTWDGQAGKNRVRTDRV